MVKQLILIHSCRIHGSIHLRELIFSLPLFINFSVQGFIDFSLQFPVEYQLQELSVSYSAAEN